MRPLSKSKPLLDSGCSGFRGGLDNMQVAFDFVQELGQAIQPSATTSLGNAWSDEVDVRVWILIEFHACDSG